MRRLPLIGATFLSFGFSAPLAQASPQEHADTYHHEFQTAGEGIVIGEVAGGFVTFGTAGHFKEGGPAMGADTLFEIGSITKVFTGILFADAVLNKKAALEDPISKHLPKDLLPADSPLHSVTMLDLATHTSGLPRTPTNLEPRTRPYDSYAHYPVEKLHDYLRSFKESDFEKRGEFGYSNLGMGLLGHLLERLAEKPYEELIAETIFTPLGMSSTFVQRVPTSIPASVSEQFATGHYGGHPTAHWHRDALCGAGTIVSTARDMTTFAKAHWSPKTPGPLRKSMTFAAGPQRKGMGLGWKIDKEGLHHKGGTAGFRSELRLSIPNQTALIELRNSTGPPPGSPGLGDFSNLAGFWEGMIDAGKVKRRSLLHILGDGRVVLYSLDQSATGIPADRAIIKEGRFRAYFSTIGGSFEGRFGSDTLLGTWKQARSYPLTYTRTNDVPMALEKALAKSATGDMTNLAGFWSGYLGGKPGLFMILEINAVGGTGEARLYSPDHRPEPIPVTKFSFDGSQFTLAIDPFRAAFSAKLDADGNLTGTWKQRNLLAPPSQALTLTKSVTRPKRE